MDYSNVPNKRKSCFFICLYKAKCSKPEVNFEPFSLNFLSLLRLFGTLEYEMMPWVTFMKTIRKKRNLSSTSSTPHFKCSKAIFRGHKHPTLQFLSCHENQFGLDSKLILHVWSRLLVTTQFLAKVDLKFIWMASWGFWQFLNVI